MIKLLISLLFVMLSLGQVQAQRFAFKPDTIVKMNGKQIAATIFKVDKFSVVFLNAGTKEQVKIPRNEISHIIYRTGKVQNVSGNVASTPLATPIRTATQVKKKEVNQESTPVSKTEPKSTTKASGAKTDSVFKRDGKILIVSVAQTTDKIVFYKIGTKKDVFSIDKKDIAKIVYNDGRTEEFAAPAPKLPLDVKCDTLIHLSGKRILAQVLKVNADDFTVQKPDEPANTNIPRKDIEKIIYRGGRIEEFNKPILVMLDETQWEAVMVSENASDVVGLYKRGTVIANSSSDSRDVKSAKKSATIRLQKKASALKGNIVLITRQEAKGGYGEVPGYEIEGVVYGFEPSAEETIEGAK